MVPMSVNVTGTTRVDEQAVMDAINDATNQGIPIVNGSFIMGPYSSCEAERFNRLYCLEAGGSILQ